jgi:protein HOOK3
LTLVDKSQTVMLAEVRKSVAEEQTGTDKELKSLKEELERAKQTINMQLSQINSLLLDKVDLQSTGISQRDALLLKKESTSGTDAAMDPSKVPALKSELKQMQESVDQTKDQLKKARHFIRQQDKLFKEQHQARANVRMMQPDTEDL